jgi:hypothetical protein
VAPVPAAVASTRNGALGIATMFSWLFTAGVGTYMLRSVVVYGGLRKQRSVRDGLPPSVLFGHFTLAICGLVMWICYLAIGWPALAWVAVCLLMPAIGLGLCTVILWTPYPRAPGPAYSGPLASPGGVDLPGGPAHDDPGGGALGGLLPGPAPDAVRGRLTDATMARALTDDALAARLIDEVIASLPDPSRRVKKPRVYPSAIIPFGHGLGAVATFVLAVVTAAGAS